MRDPKRSLSMQALLDIEGCAQTQILKQPDVLMLQFLLPDRFTGEEVKVNYDYYDPRTDHEHGSSLGPSISAIMACRVGDSEGAYQHFMPRGARRPVGRAPQRRRWHSCGQRWRPLAGCGDGFRRVAVSGRRVVNSRSKTASALDPARLQVLF